jgi:hypothetical protein
MRSTRRFRRSVILTTLLSIGLVLLTPSLAFGQSSDSYSVSARSDSGKNNPVKIEVINPADSPVLITLTGVYDNPYFNNVKTVDFTLQNLSQKRIAVYIPLLSSASFTEGNGIYRRYDFGPGKIIETELQLQRDKLKLGEKLTLSIDYILFSDGSTWGPDSQKQSELLSGEDEGEKYAISQVKRLLKDQNKEELFKLLKLQQEGKIDDNPPEIDKTKSYKWQRGFLGGYQYLLWQLLPYDEKQELEAISSKLGKIEKQNKDK